MFQPYYTRRKKINPNEEGKVIAFTDKVGDSWEEFTVVHPKFREWMFLKTPWVFSKDIEELSNDELNSWFKKSPWYKSTANDIDWKARLEMQSVVQQFTTHSISSTLNLPKETSKEEVGKIYTEAWEKGLKGVTVYVDGSRDGVLITKDTKTEDFTYNDAAKRPRTLNCDVHLTTYRGTEFVVFVGLLGGKPYEVFALENVWDIKSTSEADITKKGNGRYDVGFEERILEDITKEMSHEEESITRMLSFGLRHGGDITFAVEQLRKSKGDITSFSKAVARVLNKYVKERDTNVKCPECGDSLILEEGCSHCNSCGYSKC